MLKLNSIKVQLLLLFFFSSIFFSCKKDLGKPTGIDVSTSKNIDGLPPYPFDWEGANANFMPTPPGYSLGVPWGSGVNRRFSDDILTDYKKTDGWVLLYNVFNTQSFPTPAYFMLYNKYRGLVRIYFYLPSYSPVPSNYVTFNLALGGTSPVSSLLNFAGNDLIDLATNLSTVSQEQPYQLVATGAWYASQFELAYDPNIVNKSYSDVNLAWNFNATNISTVNLDGNSSGTLKGTIGNPASSPNIGGILVKGAFYATGAAVLSNNPTLFPSKIQTAISNAITAGLQGSVKNVLSAIFGGNSANTQEVNLNINTDITLSGTTTNNSQVLATNFYIPGTIGNQAAPTFSPGYNQPLGVFNITKKPIIKWSAVSYPITTSAGSYYEWDNDYTIDKTSYSIVINPAVQAIAQVSLIKTEMILLNPLIVNTPQSVTFSGSNETIGTYNAYSDLDGMATTYIVPHSQPTNSKAGVRLTFRVTPNNGAPPVTLVKTFAASIIKI